MSTLSLYVFVAYPCILTVVFGVQKVGLQSMAKLKSSKCYGSTQRGMDEYLQYSISYQANVQ